MKRWVVFSAALLALALFPSVAKAVDANYPATRINASSIIIDTKVYTIETSDGKLVFNYKSPRTGALTGDKCVMIDFASFLMRFSLLRENFCFSCNLTLVFVVPPKFPRRKSCSRNT
jgi:hypothetical protein